MPKKIKDIDTLTDEELKQLKKQDLKLQDFIGCKLVDIGNEEIGDNIAISLKFNNGFKIIVTGQHKMIRKE